MNLHRATILLLTTLFLSACNSPTTTPVPAATVAPSPTILLPDQGLHFLMAGTDNEPVQLKRLPQGWIAYHPASWGTTIQRGDLIQPPPNGTATILCADLTIHVLTHEAGSPCQVTEPVLFWDGARIVNPMAPGQPIPFIISPRNTKILDEHPWLRWHDTGANSYTVSIIEAGSAIWEQTGVTGSELLYPNDAPPLEPDVSYLLEVVDEDSGASSGQDPAVGLGFQLLASEDAAAVIQTRDDIMALPLDEAAKNFTLAVYYAGQGFYGDALAALNEATLTQESPQLLLWRGRVLTAVRLNEDAKAAYADAVALAETIGDIESQAQAETYLWRMTGDMSHFDTAISLYQQLGDEHAIVALQNAR